jgi:hypothetical protein
MNTPAESPTSTAKPTSARQWARRIAGVVILNTLLVVVLWITAFSLVTSLMIGSGVVVVVMAACTVSDVIAVILDAVASAILAAVSAILAGLNTILAVILVVLEVVATAISSLFSF